MASEKDKAVMPGISWAHAARDVIVQSMNRGQLPVLAVSSIFFLMVWRMPSEDVSKLAFSVIDRLSNGELLGWALFLVALAGWFVHARRMRQDFAEESKRIGREKSSWQGKAAGQAFNSSRPRRRH